MSVERRSNRTFVPTIVSSFIRH